MATAKKPMTKAQTVAYFAEKFELTKNTANAILDELAGLAVSETKKTGAFTLNGIGKLVVSKRKARTGRNPQTGKEIKIAATTVPRFTPGATFKTAVAGKKAAKKK